MAETALTTAFDANAPAGERAQAMHESQLAVIPSSVPDMGPLVEFMREQYEEQRQESEFAKSLMMPNAAPYPSFAAREHKPGMQSVWLNDTYGNGMGDWRERQTGLSFDMLRHMVDQTPVLGAVVLTRIRQVQRLCRASDGNGPGFRIQLKDHGAKFGPSEQKTAGLLQGFFTNCGWETNPRQRTRLKRDNFSGFMAKLIRDSLVLDSAPIETEFKRNRSLGLDGMYAVDGATIRLASEQGYRGEDEIFALQVVEGNIRAAYTYDDLIYVPRNPRTDVVVGGYGMSETELLVKTVTGYLNAFNYNTSYFDKNAIPKGMLHLAGNYDQSDLNAFKRYWNAMVRGANNAWSMPVMVSKDMESKASFENFGVDVNEIMFAKWMTFLTSIICACYGIAPDEINFESFTAGTSSLSGSDTEEKLINSKDKGLRPLLAHFEDLFSDYVVSEFGDKYCFRWTGLDEDDAATRWDREKTTATFNEARKSMGMDPVKGLLGDAPLYQPLIGTYMQDNQPEQPADDYGTPGAGGPPPPGGGQPPTDPNAPPDDSNSPPGGVPSPFDDAKQQPRDGAEMQKSFGLPVFMVAP
jgi:hypothetical protein